MSLGIFWILLQHRLLFRNPFVVLADQQVDKDHPGMCLRKVRIALQQRPVKQHCGQTFALVKKHLRHYKTQLVGAGMFLDSSAQIFGGARKVPFFHQAFNRDERIVQFRN